jgi:hypothetical protein
MIIYLVRLAPNARQTAVGGHKTAATVWRDATIPEDLADRLSLPLFCLAPHGVFPASALARRAVSSYLAFSPLPNEQLAPLARPYVFCDTFRRGSLARTAPARSARHAAVWCSDFPLADLAARQRSSAIVRKISHSGTQAVTKKQSF